VKRKRAIAAWLLFIVTAAAAGAAVVASPVFLVVPAALLPIVATWAYPESVWPFVPLTTIVISPTIFVVNGEPFPYGDAVQKAILIIAGLCLALALGLRWSWLGAAAIAVVGLAGLASVLNIGGRVEVSSEILARATVGYGVPFLFFFINWQRLGLRRGLEYLSMLPLACLIAGVVLQIAGVRGLPDRGPLPGVYTTLDGVPRLQGALVAAHLALLALVGLASALCLLASNTDRGYRNYLWVALNFIILMATVTRADIAVGIALIVAYVVLALGPNRLRTSHPRRSTWLIAAIAVAGCAIAAPALIMRTTRGGIYESTFNTSGRKDAWQFFQGFVAENPLTGKGLGFSSIAVERYSPPHVWEGFRAPHNEYLHFSVDGGIFFAIGLFLVILSAFVIAGRAHSGGMRALVAVFALGTMALSFVDNTFSTVQFSVPVVILLCLLAAHPTSRSSLPGRHRANTRHRGDNDSFLQTVAEGSPDSPRTAHDTVA
jgi:teichuronic acid biosynthesis protein TuaE